MKTLSFRKVKGDDQRSDQVWPIDAETGEDIDPGQVRRCEVVSEAGIPTVMLVEVFVPTGQQLDRLKKRAGGG